MPVAGGDLSALVRGAVCVSGGLVTTAIVYGLTPFSPHFSTAIMMIIMMITIVIIIIIIINYF